MVQNDTITQPLPDGQRLSRTTADILSPVHIHPVQTGVDHVAWRLAACMAAAIAAWALLDFGVEQARLTLVSSPVQAGVEVAAALAALFGALVLSLLPMGRSGPRLPWIASGCLISGLGGLILGYVPHVLNIASDLNRAMYASLVVSTLAGVLFVVGLAPSRPPRFASRWMLMIAGLGVLSLLIIANVDLLPRLTRGGDLKQAAGFQQVVLSGLTGWHRGLASIPFGLAAIAAVASVYRSDRSALARWLVVAMVLLAGSQLLHMLWPSAYSPALTIADLLRVMSFVVLSVGSVLELRRVAVERGAQRAAAQEYASRLEELARLKADFTAMVAHELANPLAAIRGYIEILTTLELDAKDRAEALATVQTETNMLIKLVDDVRAVAWAERNDFAVRPSPVPARALLADAAAFAKALRGDHPVTTICDTDAIVLADRERIGQVLRNLLVNAVAYSADGTPIELKATSHGSRVWIAVIDHGYGIVPADRVRIFQKFGRGRDQAGRKVPGAGLGLYLSRRIIRAHGTELTVESTQGVGSVFAFELKATR